MRRHLYRRFPAIEPRGPGSDELRRAWHLEVATPYRPAPLIALYRRAATAGQVDAMVNLAAMLAGIGARSSPREAAAWCRRAWRVGRDGFAAHLLALMLDPGHADGGIPKNRTSAIRWHGRAARLRISDTHSRLAWLLSSGRGRSLEQSVKHYLRSDALGELSDIGLYNLGLAYEFKRGARKNLPRAMRLYRRSAKLGYADAQLALGYNLLHGIGARRNVKEATAWYSAAAKQGEPMAHFSLGQIYAEKNLKQALTHLRFAARRGHARAQKLLSRLTRAAALRR